MPSMPLRWRPAAAIMECQGYAPNEGPAYYAAFVVDPDGYRMEAHSGKRRMRPTARVKMPPGA